MRSTSFRLARFTLIGLLALALVFANSGPAAAVWYPKNITALGDSVTGAFDASAFGPQPQYSWATGTSKTVKSMYFRLLKVDRAIKGHATNLSLPSTTMADLGFEAMFVSPNAEYVTILMGANDVCTSSVGTMTDVATFRSEFDSALQTLTTTAPQARIYVLSIPNIYRLWQLLKDNTSARTAWLLLDACAPMFDNPLSTAQVDVDRRALVLQRIIDLNTQLQQGCAAYPQCRFDKDAVFNMTFAASDVSKIDYFHPSVSGQAHLAATAWNASIFVKP